MRRILALDQSLANTGWVVLGSDGVKDWGVLKTPSSLPLAGRLGLIATEVAVIYDTHNCTELALESMAHGAVHGDNRPACVYGVLLYRACIERWPCVEANLSTVKKFFTGNGRASKAMMKEQAHAEGFEGWKNEHAADAYAIGRYVWELAA